MQTLYSTLVAACLDSFRKNHRNGDSARGFRQQGQKPRARSEKLRETGERSRKLAHAEKRQGYALHVLPKIKLGGFVMINGRRGDRSEFIWPHFLPGQTSLLGM